MCFIVTVCKYITFVMWCELMLYYILSASQPEGCTYIIYEYKCIDIIW